MVGEGYGELRDAALLVRDGRIAWMGPEAKLPAGFVEAREIDLGGGNIRLFKTRPA